MERVCLMIQQDFLYIYVLQPLFMWTPLVNTYEHNIFTPHIVNWHYWHANDKWKSFVICLANGNFIHIFLSWISMPTATSFHFTLDPIILRLQLCIQIQIICLVMHIAHTYQPMKQYDCMCAVCVYTDWGCYQPKAE